MNIIALRRSFNLFNHVTIERALPILLLLMLSLIPCVHAVTMVPLSIEDLSAKSQLIVHGTVVSKSCQRDPAGRIYTKVDLRVSEVWKGDWTRDQLCVVHGGGILGEERVEVSGQVEYQMGEQVVAFLVFNQRGEGVTLGLAQGKFHVWKDPANGILVAHNPFHGLRDPNVSRRGNGPAPRAPNVGQTFLSAGSGDIPVHKSRALENSPASRQLTLDELKERVKGERK
jgi:hypothetical protein